jgi:hypothetical protein
MNPVGRIDLDSVRCLAPVILVLTIGCSDASSPATQPSATLSNEVNLEELGDRIAGLTLTEANELSAYLRDVHGIVPAGEQANDPSTRRAANSFSDEIASLGDTIASLTLSQSTALSEYIASKHGIDPPSSGELHVPSQV